MSNSGRQTILDFITTYHTSAHQIVLSITEHRDALKQLLSARRSEGHDIMVAFMAAPERTEDDMKALWSTLGFSPEEAAARQSERRRTAQLRLDIVRSRIQEAKEFQGGVKARLYAGRKGLEMAAERFDELQSALASAEDILTELRERFGLKNNNQLLQHLLRWEEELTNHRFGKVGKMLDARYRNFENMEMAFKSRSGHDLFEVVRGVEAAAEERRDDGRRVMIEEENQAQNEVSLKRYQTEVEYLEAELAKPNELTHEQAVSEVLDVTNCLGRSVLHVSIAALMDDETVEKLVDYYADKKRIEAALVDIEDTMYAIQGQNELLKGLSSIVRDADTPREIEDFNIGAAIENAAALKAMEASVTAASRQAVEIAQKVTDGVLVGSEGAKGAVGLYSLALSGKAGTTFRMDALVQTVITGSNKDGEFSLPMGLYSPDCVLTKVLESIDDMSKAAEEARRGNVVELRP